MKQVHLINKQPTSPGLLLIAITLSLASLSLAAQPAKRGFDPNRLFTGGGLGLQFGTVTLIDVSPHIGYYLTDALALGLGGTYQYYRYKDRYYEYSTDIYGGRLFARYYLFENLFLHGEYEYLSYEAALVDPFSYFTGDTKRVGIDSYLVGGGYRQPLGANSYVNLLVLWNLNETLYTPYDNPIIRMGVDLGL